MQVAGTIDGKSVSFSTQLCLHNGNSYDSYDSFIMAAPMVLYKNGLYYGINLQFVKTSSDIGLVAAWLIPLNYLLGE